MIEWTVTSSALIELPGTAPGYAGGGASPAPSADQGPVLPWEEPQAQMDAAPTNTGAPISLSTIFPGVWSAGVIVPGAWLLWVNLRFWKKLRRSRRPLAVGCSLPVYVTGAAERSKQREKGGRLNAAD